MKTVCRVREGYSVEVKGGKTVITMWKESVKRAEMVITGINPDSIDPEKLHRVVCYLESLIVPEEGESK